MRIPTLVAPFHASISLVLLFAVCVAHPAAARTYTFAPYNLTLDLPEPGPRWRIDTVSHMRATANSIVFLRAISRDGKVILLNVSTDHVRITKLGNSDIQAFTSSMIENGARLEDSSRTTLGGLPAFMIDTRMGLDSGITANIRSYIVADHGRAFNLMLISNATNPGADSELTRVATSIRFSGSSQAASEEPGGAGESAAFDAGRIIGRLLIPAGVVGLGIGWFVRRSRSRNAGAIVDSGHGDDGAAERDDVEQHPDADDNQHV